MWLELGNRRRKKTNADKGFSSLCRWLHNRGGDSSLIACYPPHANDVIRQIIPPGANRRRRRFLGALSSGMLRVRALHSMSKRSGILDNRAHPNPYPHNLPTDFPLALCAIERPSISNHGRAIRPTVPPGSATFSLVAFDLQADEAVEPETT